MAEVFNKVMLVILDGLGVASPSNGNAVSLADPKFYQEMIQYYPVRILQASGPAVGLLWGEAGNSEVGHITIGAGRLVDQEVSRINASIADGSFYKKEGVLAAMDTVLKNDSTLHLIGLLGTGGVHSYDQHLYTLLGMAVDRGIQKIAMHIFTDGRDAPPKAALESMEKLQNKIAELHHGYVATVTGRFYAMDRGGHWDQTEKTLGAILEGQGEKFTSPLEAISKRYEANVYDEMIPPTVITDEAGMPLSKFSPGDSAIFFNYRNDRMLQLVKLFLEKVKDITVATMTSYSPDFDVHVIFPPQELKNTLGEYISNQGWRQYRAAETEKFAHVTFFFNGQNHDPWPKEDREIIKSPAGNVKNYEDIPAMSARQLTDAVVKRVLEGDDRFILVNYANADMVAHTGSVIATTEALRVLDECLAKLTRACEEVNCLLIVTADHGNCEVLFDLETGQQHKEHTSNPVAFVLVAPGLKSAQKNNVNLYTLAAIPPSGILADIAPTILQYLGLPKPDEMTGNSLAV